jgi:hypothetical protein
MAEGSLGTKTPAAVNTLLSGVQDLDGLVRVDLSLSVDRRGEWLRFSF